MAETDDLELLLAAGRGDREAFGLLAERHHRTVIHYVHRFLGRIDLATAEDIAQDVFLRAWTASPTFTPRARVLTWLLQIATNACLNHRRAMRLRRMFSLGNNDAAAPPGDAEGRDAEAEAVRDAIARLPDAQRAVIILRHYHDLSYTDIAAALEVSVSSVESLLFRARRKLRVILEARSPAEPAPQVSPGLGSSPS